MPLNGLMAHREIVEGLFAELSRRPSHAYLLAGPKGVGKALAASALAHGLLCERSPGPGFCCTIERCPLRAAPTTRRPSSASTTNSPRCDCCAACAQIAAEVHPDFTRIGRAENRTDVLIEQVRSLIAALGTKPSRGNFKVAIIDDAETLNIPAQNSLLKTLEEPPGQALILMVTAAERLLLDTVRSRMRLVHFGALSVSDLEEILARRGVPETVREGAARLARGSAARALALAEGAEPPVKQLLGALGQARGLDFTGIQKIAQEYFQNRDQAADNFELIARLLEEILWSKLNGPDASGDGESKAIADLAGSMALDAVVKCLEGAVKARTAVDAMANPRLQAEQYWMMTAQALRSE